MMVALWLHYGCTMVALWLHHGCVMVALIAALMAAI
jgi:hypothetical protein